MDIFVPTNTLVCLLAAAIRAFCHLYSPDLVSSELHTPLYQIRLYHTTVSITRCFLLALFRYCFVLLGTR